MGIEFFGKQAEVLAFNAVFPDREVPKDATKIKGGDETDKAKTSGKSSSFDPAIPLAHQTGAAGLAVEFIGKIDDEFKAYVLEFRPNLPQQVLEDRPSMRAKNRGSSCCICFLLHGLAVVLNIYVLVTPPILLAIAVYGPLCKA